MPRGLFIKVHDRAGRELERALAEALERAALGGLDEHELERRFGDLEVGVPGLALVDRQRREHHVDVAADQLGLRIGVAHAGQIHDGAWGTDVCAGMIGEIGCQSPWTDLEKRVMRGALIGSARRRSAR